MFEYDVPERFLKQVMNYATQNKINYVNDGDNHNVLFFNKYADLEFMDAFVSELKRQERED